MINRFVGFFDSARWSASFLLSLLFVGRVAQAQLRPASADAILSGLVWEAHIPADSTLPPSIRAAVDAYNRRSSAYVPKVRPSSNPEGKMILSGYAPYERRVAAILDLPRAAEIAREYVDSLKPPYEWEGYADGPEYEATFADKYRAEHPYSPLREILAVLAAHRWVCAAEAYQGEHKAADEARSHERFVRAAAVAVESKDLLIQIAARRLREHPTCFF